MKKCLVFVLVLILFISPSFAAKRGSTIFEGNRNVKFKDLPDSHWAAKAVYKMVKMGVTQGYPDGTFRGSKYMTRYETAMFLSKLADNFSTTGLDKLNAELKSEFQEIRDEINDVNRVKTSGRFELDYYLADVFASSTNALGQKVINVPLLNYRLVTTLTSGLDKNSRVILNLDTMDGGFYGGSQDLLTKMLDIRGVINLDSDIPLTLTATAGPGPQRHLTDQNEIPSEYGKTYIRPYSGLRADTRLLNTDIGLQYSAHNISGSGDAVPGMVGVSQLTVQLGWKYDKIWLLNNGYIQLTGDHFSQNTLGQSISSTNTKASLLVTANPNENIKLTGEIKAGILKNIERKNLVYSAKADFTNIMLNDSNFGIGATLAGSEYIFSPVALDEWTLIGLDPFLRPRVNSCRSFDAYITKKITGRLEFDAKANLDLSPDYRYGTGKTGSRFTYETGFNITLGSQSEANILYRSENDPNAVNATTDLFTFALLTKF